ncbi:hypothetical protein [Accumulibacter sp.]|uniref:O-antigen ligase family protein n=1 Tax=Accumulibacter sp. TaxID=2053492 RepID=UPI001AD18AFA|nr:hypothetical protein [Accumulibacter sp.]MBN8453809.1 hypothetical protein [Accumulibacter sp.]MBO3706497.1 hypothetical protein [Candidatus Accumulibacter conexus]
MYILAFVQVCYSIIGPDISGTVLAAGAVALVVEGLIPGFISGSHFRLKISPAVGLTGSATVFYVALSAIFYTGDALAEYLRPLTLTAIFFVFVVLIRAGDYHRDIRLPAVFVVIAVAGVLHLVEFGTAGVGLDRAVGDTEYRYGFQEDTNRINVTATNISYLLLTAYILGRSIQGLWPRTAFLIFAGVLALPLVATGSRAAMLIAVVTILLFELRKVGITKVMILVSFIIFILGVVQNFPDWIGDLFGYAGSRFVALFQGDDMAAQIRFEAIMGAISGDHLIFGSAKTPTEVFGASTDSSFASLIISFGLIGLGLFMGLIYLLVRDLFHNSGITRVPLFAFVPIAVRGMGEGFFLQQSTIFSLLLFLVAVLHITQQSVTPFAPCHSTAKSSRVNGPYSKASGIRSRSLAKDR